MRIVRVVVMLCVLSVGAVFPGCGSPAEVLTHPEHGYYSAADPFGAGGDFIDFTVSGTVGAFEIWGIHVVDRTSNHVHPYMKTEGTAALTALFGQVTSGDHVVTGDTNTGTLRTGRVTFSADATTEALGRFQVYACDDTSAVRTLTISSSTIADVIPGRPRQIVVRDISGGAGTNNILIVTEGAETIDGEASAVIGANNGV